MKKRILLIATILLFTTGCTCEYNLTIDNNVYKEEIILIGKTLDEISSFENDWKVPIDKDIYNLGLDPSSKIPEQNDLYNYKLRGSRLTFTYDFTRNQFENSSAVSNCYNKLTVSNYENSIVISTSQKALCFEEYPTLTNVKINITVDKKVTSNNADSRNGNTYTWNINKNNASNKSINIVLENKETNISDDNSKDNNYQNNNENNNQQKENKNDYTLYIFSGILLIIMLLAYNFVNKLKNKSDKMDD